MHYELRIMNLSRHARPMRRTSYDTHDLWDARPCVSTRGCIIRCVEFPTITHYALCIMNYPDTHVLMTRTTVRLYERVYYQMRGISQQLRIMHYELWIIKGVSKRNHHIL